MAKGVLKPRHPALLASDRSGEQELVEVVALGVGPDSGRVNVQPRWGSQTERRWVDAADVTMLSNLMDEAIEAGGSSQLTFLPRPRVLRELGFTDYSSDRWYLSSTVARSISFDVSIGKDPVAFVASEPVYRYDEMVIDSDFGQIAHYGQMAEALRMAILRSISSTIGRLDESGITVRNSPSDYDWSYWPQGVHLSGDPEADELKAREISAKYLGVR